MHNSRVPAVGLIAACILASWFFASPVAAQQKSKSQIYADCMRMESEFDAQTQEFILHTWRTQVPQLANVQTMEEFCRALSSGGVDVPDGMFPQAQPIAPEPEPTPPSEPESTPPSEPDQNAIPAPSPAPRPETFTGPESLEPVAPSAPESAPPLTPPVPPPASEPTPDLAPPSAPIPAPLPELPPSPVGQTQKESAPVVRVARAAATLRSDPVVQSANQTIVAPALTAVAVVNTAVAVGSVGVSTTILLHYLASLFTEPLILLARKRRKPWGVVYDALSKRPVDLALVRVLDAETGKVRASRVTDREGRFAFLSESSTYRLTVVHPRFIFPSVYLRGKRSDTAYDDLYHGDPFTLSSRADAITANIPLDPREELSASATRPRGPLRAHAAVAYLGPFLALGSFGISPTIPLGVLLLVHLGTLLLFRRLARPRRPKATGAVRDAVTRQPIPHAIVRLFETTFSKLVDVQPTTRSGRYGFLVGPAAFTLTVEKSGYAPARVERIDGRKAKGVVAVDINLESSESRV